MRILLLFYFRPSSLSDLSPCTSTFLSFGDIEYKTLKEDAWHTEFSGDPLIPTPDTHHEVVDKVCCFVCDWMARKKETN